MTHEEIAQWVIDNRYPKSENNKVSDLELYHGIIERITEATQNLWADEDMKLAFDGGAMSIDKYGNPTDDRESWLNDYKQKRNPATTNS